MMINKTVKFILIALILISLIMIFMWLNSAQRVWKRVDKASRQVKSFGYTVTVKGRQNNQDVFTQVVQGEYTQPFKIKGEYRADNGRITRQRKFIVVDETVYSQEGEAGKWYLWHLNDYPEAMLYLPNRLITNTDKPKYLGREEINNVKVYVFWGRIIQPLMPEDVGLDAIKIWINGKDNTILKAELSNQNAQLSGITKTITFSDYNKQIDIQPPKEEEIAR